VLRRTYQREWHRIPFRTFTEESSTRLADAAFYAAFYKVFFDRYTSPEQLDPEWLTVKREVVDFLRARPEIRTSSRILSIGCGLGLIERWLAEAGYEHIEINEISREPLRWINGSIDESRVHIGFFPQCVQPDRMYDVILLGGVDGVFDQRRLRDLLAAVHGRLHPGGHCVLLSWSYQSSRSPLGVAQDALKDGLKAALDRLGLRPRGQLWGFVRSPGQLRSVLRAAGFSVVAEGLFEPTTRFPPYWLMARRA
jgi:hypothetical protein